MYRSEWIWAYGIKFSSKRVVEERWRRFDNLIRTILPIKPELYNKSPQVGFAKGTMRQNPWICLAGILSWTHSPCPTACPFIPIFLYIFYRTQDRLFKITETYWPNTSLLSFQKNQTKVKCSQLYSLKNQIKSHFVLFYFILFLLLYNQTTKNLQTSKLFTWIFLTLS